MSNQQATDANRKSKRNKKKKAKQEAKKEHVKVEHDDDAQDANEGRVENGVRLRYSIFFLISKGETQKRAESILSQFGPLAYTQMFPKKPEQLYRCGFATYMNEESVKNLIDKKKIRYDAQGKMLYIRIHPFTPEEGTWLCNRLLAKEVEIEKMKEEVDRDRNDGIPHDIQVSSVIEGIPPSGIVAPGADITWELRIRNRTIQDRMFYRIYSPHPHLKVYDNIPKRLKKNSQPEFFIRGHSTHVARLQYKVDADFLGMMKFDLRLDGRNWARSYQLSAQVANQEEINLLSPQSDFDPIKADGYGLYDGIARLIVPFGRTPSWSLPVVQLQWARELGAYPIPESILKSVTDKGYFTDICPWTTKSTHKEKLHQLLWIEQVQMGLNLRKFDIANVELEPVDRFTAAGGEYYTSDADPLAKLFAPGVAESRPSVMKDDKVYAWIPGSKDREYEGIVRHTDSANVFVAFNFGLHKMLKGPNAVNRWNIRFELRHTDLLKFRRMHSAIDESNLMWNDPGKKSKIPSIPNPKLKQWFDEDVKRDPDQAAVVRKIVNRQKLAKDALSLPFLIFGAFGTGKSRTMAEVICQILSRSSPEKPQKILVCAITNNAVDLLMDLLIKAKAVTPQSLLRLYPFYRRTNTIEDRYLPYTAFNREKGNFDMPTLEELRRYDIIISTSEKSHDLYRRGMDKGDFTHIILDEAAQMLETEALIPLMLADDKCTVVMSGDVKQLGPTIYSQSAKQHNLGRSLMERIAEGYAMGELKFELRKNYRSSPSLSDLCSLLFYDKRVTSKRDSPTVGISQWPKLSRQVNYLIESVDGIDQREGDSPSFFNSAEALRVADLIEDLLNWVQDEDVDLDQEEIAVITPYEKQCHKIRELLRSRGLKKITVLKVDTMPGKEYSIVFLSTVRASRDWASFDKEHDLGVISNEKRMCTALTRAKECLVVLGDTFVLSRDEKWKQFMDCAKIKGAYVGTDTSDEKYIKERQQKEIAKTDAVLTAAKTTEWTQLNQKAFDEQEAEQKLAEEEEERRVIEQKEAEEENQQREKENQQREKERQQREKENQQREKRNDRMNKRETRPVVEEQPQISSNKEREIQPTPAAQPEPIAPRGKSTDGALTRGVAPITNATTEEQFLIGKGAEAEVEALGHSMFRHLYNGNQDSGDNNSGNNNGYDSIPNGGYASNAFNGYHRHFAPLQESFASNVGMLNAGAGNQAFPNFNPLNIGNPMFTPNMTTPADFARLQEFMNMMNLQRSVAQYQVLYGYRDQPIIQLETGCVCPPLTVSMINGAMEVKISRFAMECRSSEVQRGVYQVTLQKEANQEPGRELLYEKVNSSRVGLLVNFGTTSIQAC